MPKAQATIIPVTPFAQNCTLLWCTATMRAVVIDPGGEIGRILDVAGQAGVTIEAIWLTHGHIDHAAGAADLKDALAVPVIGPHSADLPLLERLPETGRTYGIPARPIVPDRWLDEGDTVSVGELSFSILHCPGHSPGSVVFVNAGERFALVGDVLFQGSVGRSDLPGGDHATLIRSIREKLLPLGDDVAFICGHGPASSIGHERANNPFLQ